MLTTDAHTNRTHETGIAEAGVPTQADQDSGSTNGDDRYRHLQPLLADYVETSPDDPHRAELREQIVTGYLPVARRIARRYAQRGEPLEDLEQVAYLGLLKAVDRYDLNLGSHFLGYAVPTITGEIRRHFRDRTWSLRVPRRLKDLHLSITGSVAELTQRLGHTPRPTDIAIHLNLTTDEVLEGLKASQAYRAGSLDGMLDSDDGAGTRLDLLGAPDTAVELFINSYSLAPHLATLPHRERAIVIMRFYDDLTQTQIADRLGLSQMHVSRLLSSTFVRLRDAVDQDFPI